MRYFTKPMPLMLLALALVACSGASGTALSDDDSVTLSTEFEGALPVSLQLAAGTFRLEGTDDEVALDQAAELVTLWQAYRSLSTSDTAAEAEIEAILDQILRAMTSDQIRAIAAMELTQEDLFALIEELGLRPELPEGAGEGGDFPGFPPGGFGGGPPPGGFGGGPFGRGGGGNLSPDEIATIQAERGQRDSLGARAGQFLIEPLIELLESRAA